MCRIIQHSGSLCALFALFFLLAIPAEARVIERIIAVVNQDIILLSALEDRIHPFLPQLDQVKDKTAREQQLNELRRKMLQMMIDEEIIKQDAQELKITVSNKDLELAISDVMRKNNLSREQLEAALQQEGKDIASYKQTILKPQMLRLRVLNARVRSRVNVSEEEIRAQYQKNMRALGVETKIRASHVFIAVPEGATPLQRDERKRYAQSILAKIKAGLSFSEAAKQYSQDPVTRTDGGDLGFFSRGTLPNNLEDVVFAMKAGQVRGPLLGERGYHLIKLTEIKESSARPFDEVKDELQEQIYMQKMEKATKAWLEEVRKRSYINIKL